MADWQSLDPEAAREAEKYDNPIPSRELILLRLDERGAPASREQLVDEFGLTTDEQLEALRRRLRAMERDGQLVYTRRGAYAPVDKLDLIRGRVSGHRDGFGFLIPDDGSDDLFLSPAQMRLFFDGDKVLARVAGFDRRGRREGAVAEVVERAHETLVGRFFDESGRSEVGVDRCGSLDALGGLRPVEDLANLHVPTLLTLCSHPEYSRPVFAGCEHRPRPGALAGRGQLGH